ncbi:hypothetical protein BIZ78_gp192 [Erwinia phage vB_EamM_Caitlin]|uniref:hypothetical protein n=1 Tax=Erwinia phage vB_EamM_Caitlin TaxID=1883379 RepID=UPI00081D2C04|nr:hypothetical protein BIZ78_gp192 [Erwinia phage vB_EamM_Caitlin]ANZ48383.1 hypothetical protein CAITLIN_88 [Erwinia phage vB_EamM_Caitlin]
MEHEAVVQSITVERDELEAKLNALLDFRNTGEFNDLPEKQQALLLMQINAQSLLVDILNMRLDELEAPDAAPANFTEE